MYAVAIVQLDGAASAIRSRLDVVSRSGEKRTTTREPRELGIARHRLTRTQ